MSTPRHRPHGPAKVVALVAALAVFAFAALCVAGGAARALTIPSAPSGRVTDTAAALGTDGRARLEAQLARYAEGRREQIAVALFPSLDGESLEDVSMHIAERWKVGSRNGDDGVLLVVFLADHKLRIEVGYGLEGRLTDAQSSQIIHDLIAPRFRAGDLEGGLRAGLAAIDSAITGRDHEGDAAPAAGAPSPRLVKLRARTQLVLTILFVLLGVPALVLWRVFGSRGHLGGPGGWTSGGGFFGGGSSGGGSFGGGGGSFGGGGSSGSW